MAQRSEPPARQAPRLNVSVLVLYLLVLISLMLNGALVWVLLRVQSTLLGSVDEFTALAADIENEVLSVPVHVDETFPVSVSVPFEYNQTFPVNTTVPISTTLMVPFEIMDTVINIRVPVNFAVPVSLSVPVALSKTFEVSTTVPVKFDMTVEVRLSDTPLPAYLGDLKRMLEEIKRFP